MEQATFRNLILRDVEAANAEEAIRKVGQRFYDEGFVKDTYIDAVVAREKNYATGLQLADIAVAMPHTDPQHVNRRACASRSLSTRSSLSIWAIRIPRCRRKCCS